MMKSVFYLMPIQPPDIAGNKDLATKRCVGPLTYMLFEFDSYMICVQPEINSIGAWSPGET